MPVTNQFRPLAWSVAVLPAATVIPSATKAAAGANLRNVCTDISAGMVGGVGGANAAGGWANLILRDGATGVGTIIWATTIGCPVSGGNGSVEAHGMNLAGSVNTAMCLETNIASASNTLSSVTLQGYVQ